ncbi:hypothetical protein AVEN_164872-1, partial [Araneus ventricosus]
RPNIGGNFYYFAGNYVVNQNCPPKESDESNDETQPKTDISDEHKSIATSHADNDPVITSPAVDMPGTQRNAHLGSVGPVLEGHFTATARPPRSEPAPKRVRRKELFLDGLSQLLDTFLAHDSDETSDDIEPVRNKLSKVHIAKKEPGNYFYINCSAKSLFRALLGIRYGNQRIILKIAI